jgi:hypothetical protein
MISPAYAMGFSQEKRLSTYTDLVCPDILGIMNTTYYHCTTRKNLESIRRRGLLAAYATGKRKAVWVCSRDSIYWALDHVCDRHLWDVSDVVAIPVAVAFDRLRKHGPGLYYILGDVDPKFLGTEKSLGVF